MTGLIYTGTATETDGIVNVSVPGLGWVTFTQEDDESWSVERVTDAHSARNHPHGSPDLLPAAADIAGICLDCNMRPCGCGEDWQSYGWFEPNRYTE